MDDLSIEASDLEDVRAPTLVRDHALDLALVPAATTTTTAHGQGEPVEPHDALDALPVVVRAEVPVE